MGNDQRTIDHWICRGEGRWTRLAAVAAAATPPGTGPMARCRRSRWSAVVHRMCMPAGARVGRSRSGSTGGCHAHRRLQARSSGRRPGQGQGAGPTWLDNRAPAMKARRVTNRSGAVPACGGGCPAAPPRGGGRGWPARVIRGRGDAAYGPRGRQTRVRRSRVMFESLGRLVFRRRRLILAAAGVFVVVAAVWGTGVFGSLGRRRPPGPQQ
jgi:hypothetical protein